MSKREQYIKMCEKAVEIQGSYVSRIPAADDIFAGKIYRGTVLFVQLTLTNMPITNDYIWLPRVEQLVKMIPDWNEFAPIDHMDFIYSEFGEECCDCGSKQYSKLFKTLTELLLAYVMQVKYEKVWDSDKNEWVKKFENVWSYDKKNWVMKW